MSICSMDINLRTTWRGNKLVVVRTVFAAGQEYRQAARSQDLGACLPITEDVCSQFFEEHTATSTLVEVKGLFIPSR
ncbi:hypothetical protein MES5069_710024 [Mesorhizobium escarrei]|uniref:DUF982 domain-containing protein n=1 Tax=Mesorhizobium escarrei TaxID=666018 RepID=A0ABN8KJ80_9HYPH|nr:hypothetical protein MES5069_710024 [Mesorhizobium escarrei]